MASACSGSNLSESLQHALAEIELNLAPSNQLQRVSFERLKELLAQTDENPHHVFNRIILPHAVKFAVRHCTLGEALPAGEPHTFLHFFLALHNCVAQMLTIQNIDVTYAKVPARYFLIVNELIPDIVDGTPFSFEEMSSDASTIGFTPPPSPSDIGAADEGF